jgi:flavin-dependent amine oxidoreductase
VSLTRKQMLRIMVGSGVAAAAGLPSGVAAAQTGRVMERDVCVIGGGSSGTYTAVRLRDMGKSVALVERTGRLGGHTQSFRDPVTGGTVDIGVVVFHDLPLVRDYFAKLGVPVQTSSATNPGAPKLADFRTGKIVQGYELPQPTTLPTYFGLLQQYPYLDAGFTLPNPVPPELLMPFEQFVAAHGLEDLVPLVFRFGQGLGDVMAKPTIYVMKNFGIDVITNIFNGTFLAVPGQNNGELYEKATTYLGDDVLLNATILDIERDRGVLVKTATPHGIQTIRAKKLVVTAPPVPENLAPFDLDRTERVLFSRFRPGFYFTAVVRLPGVPDTLTVRNVGADTPHHNPPLPGIYMISPTGIPELFNVKYGSTIALTDAQVRSNILVEIKRLVAAGTFPATQPKIEIFKSHSPFELTVTAADIASGFYRNLNALQGHNNTFYNGAAFHTHDSSLLWQFTETLLPQI